MRSIRCLYGTLLLLALCACSPQAAAPTNTGVVAPTLPPTTVAVTSLPSLSATTAPTVVPTRLPPPTAGLPNPQPTIAPVAPRDAFALVLNADGALLRVNSDGSQAVLAQPAAEQRIIQLAASPDGAMLAYVQATDALFRPKPDASSGSASLWLISTDGSASPRQVTELLPAGFAVLPGSREAFEILPALQQPGQLVWAPDSSRLAFVSAATGQVDLFVVSMNGVPIQLTDTALIEFRPSWAPDLAHLAFIDLSSFGTGAGWGEVGVAIIALNSGTQQRLFGAGSLADGSSVSAVSNLAWLNAEQLVYAPISMASPEQQLQLASADGSLGPVIYRGRISAFDLARGGALAIGADDRFGDSAAGSGLLIWRPGDSTAQRVLDQPVSEWLRWSPSASALAFFSMDAQGATALYRTIQTGGAELLGPVEGPALGINWSPDEQLIAAGNTIYQVGQGPVATLEGALIYPLGWTAANQFFYISQAGPEPEAARSLHIWSAEGDSELLAALQSERPAQLVQPRNIAR